MKNGEMTKSKILSKIKTEKIYGWIMIGTGILSAVITPIIANGFDNGSIHYGIVVPIGCLWYGIKCLNKAKELKSLLPPE